MFYNDFNIMMHFRDSSRHVNAPEQYEVGVLMGLEDVHARFHGRAVGRVACQEDVLGA